jgi:hypothetical protein
MSTESFMKAKAELVQGNFGDVLIYRKTLPYRSSNTGGDSGEVDNFQNYCPSARNGLCMHKCLLLRHLFYIPRMLAQ